MSCKKEKEKIERYQELKKSNKCGTLEVLR